MRIERKYLKLLALPLLVALLVAAYFLLWRLLGLPEYKELINVAQGLLNRHGSWIVFVAAAVEGILLVGNYFPGGLVIFLAVISAGHDFIKVALVVALVCAGFMISNTLNYLLGRFGWYHLLVKFGMSHQLVEAEEKWAKKSFKVIFLSYWQANLAALIATAAGILKINFKQFLMEALVGVVFWNIMWALLVYIFRQQAVNAVTNVYVIFGVVMAWAVFVSIQRYRKLNKERYSDI